ncbi:MAG: hypothetical protein DHS20C13_26200 [Thermodesulfobacteriota bacterium]|nr:MAG: hypothetical protein DHS20C13_26200 [Thermodesulfobacteriota bacterium]
MKCAEGYYLDGTDCLEITDCYLVSGNECSICEEGFANTQTDTHCSDGGNNDACNETDAATCVDGKPGIHFYGANPCEYGFKWDTDKCVPITNPYCAIVADNGNCTECFTFLDNTCESESTIFL